MGSSFMPTATSLISQEPTANGGPVTKGTSDVSRRRLLIAIVIAMIAVDGVCFVLLLAPTGQEFVLPGPLTRAHATFEDECESCHVGLDGLTKPVQHGLLLTEAALAESRLCIECHDRGQHGLLAHSLPAETLARPGAQAAPSMGPARSSRGELACASCHREHRGVAVDLTAITDDACQSCHGERFDSWTRDHPEFESYPFERPTRIAFTHRLHRDKHFMQEEAPFRCQDCHAQDSGDEGGRFMMSFDYERACTSCHHHQEQIRGKGHMTPGVAFFTVPALDLETLSDRDRELGGWPADAADYDGMAPPLLEVLLAGDPAYPELEADRALFMEWDPMDLMDAPDSAVEAAQRYGQAIERLVSDLGQRDLIAARLSRAAGGPDFGSPEAEVRAIVDAFSGEVGARLLSDWFPALGSKESTADSDADPEQEGLLYGTRSGGDWYRDDEMLTLEYRPLEHRDAFLKAWHDLAAPRAASSAVWRDTLAFLQKDGRCTKCHTIEDDPNGHSRFAWQSFRPPAGDGFTRFSHQPHLVLSKKLECVDCHELAPWSPDSESITDLKPQGFASLEKSQCVDCHRDDSTSCTLCHNYHIDRPTRH